MPRREGAPIVEADVVRRFVEFMTSHGDRLRAADPVEVANEIGDFLVSLDEGLGVEVSGDDSLAERHVIVTAFSDPSRFGLVESVVAALDLPGWRFECLKPPRGFGFELTLGDVHLDAKLLELFLDASSRTLLLCIPAHVMSPLPDDTTELAWLIVETGVGEKLAAELERIDFVLRSTVPVSSSIAELQERLEVSLRQ